MTENYLDILAETIRTNWDQPALTDFYLTEDGSAQDTSRGNHYSYGEMYAELCRVANLLTSLGLQKGDHIAICGANSAHWVIAYLAVAKMQGVSVTVMHSLMPEEIARLVAFSDAKALFTDANIWEELLPSFQGEKLCSIERPVNGRRISGDKLLNVISLADWSILHSNSIESRRSTDGQPTVSYSVTIPSVPNRDISFPESAPDDLAMICFTSGSSGKPKGVMLSNFSLSDSIYNSLLKTDYIDKLDGDDAPFLAIMPFAHMFGFVDNLLSHIVFGKQIVIAKDTLSTRHLLSLILLCKPYGLAIIPSVFEKIVNYVYKIQDSRILHSLEYILIAGAGVDKKVEEEAISLGVPYYVGYGLSEMIYIALNYFKYRRKGSSGKVLSNKKIKFETSEILVKGENVMLGYYKDPEATAAKIDSDGWLHTGDKGHLDEDGYLYVEGRLKQDIIVLPNGENIRPDHIESLINALPEIKESIVLARDGHLVAIVVPFRASSETSETIASSPSSSLRRAILRTINPSLPLFSQLYDVEITDTPLARTEKQTLKRYLYK